MFLGSTRIAEYRSTLVGALYRAGRLEAVVQRLRDESGPSDEEEDAVRWFFLAMANARLGRPAEARRWLKAATLFISPALQRKPWEEPLPWDARLILQCLRREAGAMILALRASS